jgi:3-oxoacyl-[acyl-carrier-protein] synthase II
MSFGLKRVVITGIGAVTPLANGVSNSWKKLIAGESAIKKITRFDASNISCQIAAEVPLGDEDWQFNPERHLPKKDVKKNDTFILFAIGAADEAIKDSGWKPEKEEDFRRTGVLIGSGIGGLPAIEECSLIMNKDGYRRISPFFIPSALINLASGQVSIKYGYRGPNHSVVTACATGSHAIGDAMRLIQFGDADVMIAGSSEGTICPAGIGGFAAARALSTKYNETPQKASRPWDEGRDGFVMGEGAGVLVLEEYEHAKKRGANIYAEIIGYGLSGDGYHITAPHPEGRGAYDAMYYAMKRSGLKTSDVDYINAHGTSTPLGDIIELNAVKRLFGADAYELAMSSTKSSIAHLLGGAGSVEAIFAIMAMKEGIVPPTLNLENPSEGCDLNLVPNKAQERKVKVSVSNSFGFGGTNVSLVFKKV